MFGPFGLTVWLSNCIICMLSNSQTLPSLHFQGTLLGSRTSGQGQDHDQIPPLCRPHPPESRPTYSRDEAVNLTAGGTREGDENERAPGVPGEARQIQGP